MDELMLSIASKAPNADSTRIAVLACLHLADKLRAIERDLNQLKQRVDRKSEEFAGMLEQIIEGAGKELENAHDSANDAAGDCRRGPFRGHILSDRDRRLAPQPRRESQTRWRLADGGRPLLAARRQQYFRARPRQRDRASRWTGARRHIRIEERQNHCTDGWRRARTMGRIPGRRQSRPPQPLRHQALR